MTIRYRSVSGFPMCPHKALHMGQVECSQLDMYERQGMDHPLTVRFVAATYKALMTKVRRDA